jgi:hypothetical protein
MTTESVHRSNPPINAKDFGVPAEFAERAENYAQWAIAAERDRMIADGWRQCAQGQKTSQFCAVAEQVRQEEREACAKVCEARYMGDNNREDMEARRCAAAIRARGQPDPKVTHLNEWARDRLARHGIQLPEDEDGNPSF